MSHPTSTPASPPSWRAAPGMGLRLGEAAAAIGPLLRTVIGPADLSAERVGNDTRELATGDCFVALTDKRDGHVFVPDALAKGARFVIVSQWPLGVEVAPDQGVLVVRDVDAALVRLAAYWRAKYPILAVGVGGGVGKTTTKEMVAGLLAQRYGADNVLKTPANWNDLRGSSLTLLGLRANHQRAVLEMGMDRPGEVAQLAEVGRPHWGIVTAVSATHLEYFPTMTDLIATERGLVEALPPAGLAILNDNDRLVRGMMPFARCPIFTFGTLPEVDLRAVRVTSRGTDRLSFTVKQGSATVSVATNLLGRHLVTSALAALSVALADGWSLSDAAEAMAQVHIPQRIRLRPGVQGSTIIDDTYNASPESMRAALDLLADWPREQGGRRLALLGTMRELGPRSWRAHQRLGFRAAWRCQTLWVTGEERATIAAGAKAGGLLDVRVFADPAEAAANLAANLQPHDVVLVKASHAVGLDQVVEMLVDGEQEAVQG